MPTKPKKVGFYYLTSDDRNNFVDSTKAFLNYIMSLNKELRKFEIGNNKFMFLDSFVITNNGRKCKILLKNATHSSRANLLHRDTVEERENPKTIEEGEVVKTHIAMKFGDQICFVQERVSSGVNVNQFITYLNQFAHQNPENNLIRFGYDTAVKENFLEEVNRLRRVVGAKIIVDKQILGSDALNFNGDIDSIKHDIVINVRAKDRDNIADFVQEAFARINGGNRVVNRIRIEGKDMNNQNVVLNTEFLERQEYINAEYRPGTGELVSDDVFQKMYQSLNNFN
ncbi:hypothetical protein P2W68_08185 [Chryseobacterium arthrosphaerae]|uniref:hypothetical protein n=1 Tax=Chryseobacterium arthrosphaerae TaxID=651561 RepID=UPI0023E1DCB3|nr:hypothetical protein [Chryseobacterium arthrosphaerae]WES99589.1 hypothetical protein P2W68_08185 [Chryseobacterium arthrosphaerae]